MMIPRIVRTQLMRPVWQAPLDPALPGLRTRPSRSVDASAQPAARARGHLARAPVGLVQRLERPHGLGGSSRSVRSITSGYRGSAGARRGTRAPLPRWRRSARTAPCRPRAPLAAPGAGTGRRRDRPPRSSARRPPRDRAARSGRSHAFAAVQRVGDRDAHVRRTEVGEHRPVGQLDQAVDERLRCTTTSIRS